VGLQMSNYLNPLDLNALGVTFLSSSHLSEAAHRLKRYEHILNTRLSFSIEETGSEFHLLSEVDDLPDYATVVIEDTRQAALITLARRGLNKGADATEVCFTYPEPVELGDHYGAFRCSLKFNQPTARITFKSSDARRPFTDANRDLALRTDSFLDEILSELDESDLVSRVKRVIIDALPSGAPAEEDVARQVFISSRTLQRRLAEEGTNYRTLLLEVRRELARRYIADKDMPLAEISYMLGFSDASSFSRAFKRWTGEPPALYREKLVA